MLYARGLDHRVLRRRFWWVHRDEVKYRLVFRGLLYMMTTILAWAVMRPGLCSSDMACCISFHGLGTMQVRAGLALMLVM